MTRDIANYTDHYTSLPFEPVQAACRRRMLLKQVARLAPKSILEIGCGQKPIFADLPDTIAVTVVEPSSTFAENARALAVNRPNVTIHHSLMEDMARDGHTYDLIILSSLLHEVDHPRALLASVRAQCAKDTIIHINTPNARSMHRLLGVAMGIIPDSGAISQQQQKLQQHRPPYDQESLEKEVGAAGFTVLEKGGLLIKPFTHSQMQQLMDSGFLNEAMITGLERLADSMPDYGSEIWVNAKVSP